MANATGGQKYDFKTIGIKNRGNLNWTQYSYRGMPFTDENGNKFIASARDIGNYSAGYICFKQASIQLLQSDIGNYSAGYMAGI